jgi:hypothetical protein
MLVPVFGIVVEPQFSIQADKVALGVLQNLRLYTIR